MDEYYAKGLLQSRLTSELSREVTSMQMCADKKVSLNTNTKNLTPLVSYCMGGFLACTCNDASVTVQLLMSSTVYCALDGVWGYTHFSVKI